MNEGKKEKLGSLYKYGCVMIELNISNWDELTSVIDPEDVYIPEDPAKGVETNPHVTLLYPVDPKVKFEEIKDILDRIIYKKINIEIDGVECFENSECDVVKLNIIPNVFIKNIHNELSKLPNFDKHIKFSPHITLAFVKSGHGKKYENENYKHIVNDIKRIKYTTPSGDKFYYDI